MAETDTSKPELVETAMAAVCDCIAIDHPGADNASDGETLMLFHGIGPTGTGGHITLNIKEVVEAVLSVTGYEQLSSAKAEIERLRGERDAAIEKCAQEIEKIAQLLFEREISDPDSDDFDADAYEEAEYATNLLKGTAAAIRALSNTTPHLDPKDAVIAELGSTAAQDVLAERQRQKDVEGWTPERDDTHTGGQMAGAAACYALTGVAHWACGAAIDTFWPWDKSWWKPTNPRRDLVKAAALLLAEIERLDRLSLAKQGGSDG